MARIMLMAMIVMMVMMMMMTFNIMGMNYVTMVMHVSMTFVAGTTEETTNLMRRKIRNNIQTGLEFVRYSLYVMGLHDGKHNLLINCQRHIYLCTLNDGRPVLISNSMAEFERDTDDIGRRTPFDTGKIHYQYR